MFLHLPKCLELSTDVAKQSLLNTEVIRQIVTEYLVLLLYTAYILRKRKIKENKNQIEELRIWTKIQRKKNKKLSKKIV